MNLKTTILSPHMVENTLDLVKKRRPTIEETYNEIFVSLCPSLKDLVMNMDCRSS